MEIERIGPFTVRNVSNVINKTKLTKPNLTLNIFVDLEPAEAIKIVS